MTCNPLRPQPKLRERLPFVRTAHVNRRFSEQSTDRLEDGLGRYRTAALRSPEAKRAGALREVIVAEQVHRMLMSNQAILTFEDIRLKLVAEQDRAKAEVMLDQMEAILREEIARTELALVAVTRDSRIGFQYECDYVYTPFSLREKLEVLRDTLENQLPAYRVGIVAARQ